MYTIDPSILKRYLHLRQHYYQLLLLFFFQPLTKETLLELKGDEDLASFNEMGLGGQKLYQFFTRVTEGQLETETEEFNRLFVGPGEIVAPPWESYYTSREQLLFDESTFQVRELYHRFGLQFEKENNEPDDHITVELAFMLFLVQQTMLSEESLNDASEHERFATFLQVQLQFLSEHLGVWVPAFCEKIYENSTSLLYTGAALLLKDFIESEIESILEIKEALGYVRS